MEKEANLDNVIRVLLENEWYNKTLVFFKNAFNLDDATMQLIINGNKPSLSEEDNKILAKRAEELLYGKKEQNDVNK